MRLAALLLLLPLALAPQQELRPAPPPSPWPPTRLAREVIARCDAVIVARALSTRPVGRTVVFTTVEVVDPLAGADVQSGARLVVMATPDELAAGERYLLFLERAESGEGRHRLRHRVHGRAAGFEARVRVARRTIELLEVPIGVTRDRAAISMLLDELERDEPFATAYALEELDYASVRRPELFRAIDRMRMLSVAADPERDGTVASTLERLVTRLERAEARLSERDGDEQSRP